MIKVGDKIRVMVNMPVDANVKIGDILTIESVTPRNDIQNKRILAFTADGWFFDYADIQTGLLQIIDFKEVKAVINPECLHQWRLYEGFTNRYEYCSKCDKKRD